MTLPDGTILYSRRDAHDIVHLNPATGAKTSVGTVPGVDNTDGKGGLPGLAISAGFSGDHWLYVNPFGHAVWSYGHRNPQGLAFDSQGRLWEQEFGNAVLDETNLITKGGNYGWPACEGTSGTCGTAGFIAPKRTYATADGSCSGIAIVRDVLYVACERGTRMYREVISGSDLTDVQAYFNGTYGRLRTVEPAPDGGLWLTTTNNGDKYSAPTTATRGSSTSRWVVETASPKLI